MPLISLLTLVVTVVGAASILALLALGAGWIMATVFGISLAQGALLWMIGACSVIILTAVLMSASRPISSYPIHAETDAEGEEEDQDEEFSETDEEIEADQRDRIEEIVEKIMRQQRQGPYGPLGGRRRGGKR